MLLSHTAMANITDSLGVAPQEESEQTPSVEITTQDADVLWSKASEAYINEDYTTAIELYNAISSQGLLSSRLYYNMGNAYYKSGQIGKAILYYKKAHKLSPADEDIHYNLEIAQAQTKDNIEEVPEFFLKQWSHRIASLMDSTWWTILSIVALILALASVLVFLLSQDIKARKWSFSTALLSLVVAAVSLIYASAQRTYMLEHNEAVIMSSSVSIKSSPDKSATDLFLLHEGTTVHVTERLDNWCNITIADGKKGWIEAKRIEII